MKTLDTILGETEATEWKQSRARGLVLWHRVDEAAALALVEQAVVDHDPAILAAEGQVWTRRDEVADDSLPAVLYVTDWLDRDHVAVEDGVTGSAVVPVLTLHAYTLDSWQRP